MAVLAIVQLSFFEVLIWRSKFNNKCSTGNYIIPFIPNTHLGVGAKGVERIPLFGSGITFGLRGRRMANLQCAQSNFVIVSKRPDL